MDKKEQFDQIQKKCADKEITEVDRSILADKNIIFIENDKIKLGVNLGVGGAVTYLAEHGKENLINSYDWGRQIQMSFYSGPSPYIPEGCEGDKDWKFLGWNPIQSGDCFGNPSKILKYEKKDNEIYVKCIPMHWPLNNVPGECTFETWYKLEGYGVKVKARINMDRPDKTQYGARDQELPAIYTNGKWDKLVSYIGTKPCTGDSVIELCNKENKLGWPWVDYIATENWAALVDDDNYGLGVYNETSNIWKGGFAGDHEKGGGPFDFETGYIAPLSVEILDYNGFFEYEYELLVGTVDFIRDTFVAKRKANPIAKEFIFKETRKHFRYGGTGDTGLPVDGLEFSYREGVRLIGPGYFFDVSEIKAVEIDAEFSADVKGTLNFRNYDGKVHDNGYHIGDQSIPFDFKAGGRKTYEIPVNMSGATLGFDFRFENEGKAKVYSIRLK